MICLRCMVERLSEEKPELTGDFLSKGDFLRLLRIDPDDMVEHIDSYMSSVVDEARERTGKGVTVGGIAYEAFIYGLLVGTNLSDQPDTEEGDHDGQE